MMNTKDRKKLLIDKDLTITELSSRIKKDRSWVTKTIYGHVTPKPTQKAISRELDVPVEELFPSHEMAA